MLQQTQVDRVVPKYRAFIRKYPNPRALAAASLMEVLQQWQGLGYNRRARYLWEAAQRWGTVEFDDLPGVGPYTARAVRVFAFNKPEILIETNIRAVLLHHLFPRKTAVSDRTLAPLLTQLLTCAERAGITPREWYSALMDYGAYLKRTTLNPSRRSAHHVRQQPFQGSMREVRGAVLRAALRGEPVQKLKFPQWRIRAALQALKQEKLI